MAASIPRYRVAVTLEALFPDRREEVYGQLAHHYFEAEPGDGENQAREYAMCAGARDMALALLDEARSTARALGMRALAERLVARLEQRPAPAPTALGLLDDLSPREVEVPRLLAAGKSNRDIADALCISLSTVASHVRHILTKTGCANRTEAAAYALRHGLTEHEEPHTFLRMWTRPCWRPRALP